jgi:hypothetical protein
MLLLLVVVEGLAAEETAAGLESELRLADAPMIMGGDLAVALLFVLGLISLLVAVVSGGVARITSAFNAGLLCTIVPVTTGDPLFAPDTATDAITTRGADTLSSGGDTN